MGAFAVDEAPTGSKDPYGLRRAATGLVRIALDRGWDVSPMDALRSAHERLRAQGADLALDADATCELVVPFLIERLGYILAGEGVGAEALAAARGVQHGAPSLAAWARDVEAARGDAGVGRGVDGGHPPAAHRAQGAGRG